MKESSKAVLKIVADMKLENIELRDALKDMVRFSALAHQLWDRDEDMKTGKYLLAMAGFLPGYSDKIDAVHALLKRLEGYHVPDTGKSGGS